MSTPGAELNLALKVTADTQAGVTNLGKVATTNDQIAQAATRAADALTRLATSADALVAIAAASTEAQAAQTSLAASAQAATTVMATEGAAAEQAAAGVAAVGAASAESGVAQAALAESAQAAATVLAAEGETAEQAAIRIQAMVKASLEAAAAQAEQAAAAAESVAASAATTRATDAQVAAYERSMAAQLRSGAAVSREVQQIAALEAALKRGAKSTEELGAIEAQIDELMRRGALSTAEQTAALERLNQIEEKLAAQRRQNGSSGGGNGGSGNGGGHGGDGGVLNSSFARRELGRLGSDAVNGNWGRFEQTSFTLANSIGLLGKVFTTTGISITAATAVLGAFAYAAVSAAEDEAKLNEAIGVTGNNAGLTSTSFEKMANGISGTNIKLSESREIIEQLAASGRVGQQSLAAVAQAAADISELTGANAEKASQEALRYFDGTTTGAMKANEQFHFLTTAVYDQIKALQEAGDVEGAQDVASRALHEAAIGRIEDVKEHVTGLTQVWHNLGKEVSDAWERMKLGTSVALGTASDQNELFALQGRKESAENHEYSAIGRIRNMFFGSALVDKASSSFEQWSPEDEARLQALQARVAKAQADADQAAQNSKLNDAALKANAAIDKRQEQYDKPTARKNALDELNAQFLAAWNDPNAASNPRLKGVTNYVDEQGKVQFSGGMYDQQKAEIEKRFTDRAAGAADRADLSAQTAQARQQLQLYTDAFTNAERTLDAARKAGKVSDDDYWAAKRKNIDDLEAKQVAELEQEKAAIAGHGSTAAERIRIDQQVQGIEAQITKARSDAAAKRAVLDDQEHQATEKKIEDANRLQEAYLRATGQEGAAAALRIQDQYTKALKQANLNGDTESAAKIKVIIDVETAKAQLGALRSDISTVQSDQQRQEQDIQARLQAGQLNQIEAQRQLFDLHKQTYEAITAELPKLQELAAATADPKVIEQVQQLRSEMDRLGLETDQITTSVRNDFQSSFDDVFNGLGTRITNARQLLNALLLDLARGLQRIASQQLSEMLTNQLSGATSWLSQLLGGSGQTIGASAGASASATTATAISSAGATAATSIGTAGTTISTAIVDAGTVAASSIAAAATGGSASGGGGGGWINMLTSLFGSSGAGGAGSAANDGSYFFNFAADAGGFSEGGYTGDIGHTEVAGVVHGGEHVTRAAVVAQPGVRAMLDDLNTHGVAGLSRHIPGFMEGGYVAPLSARASQSPLFPSRDGGMVSGRQPINLSLINVPHHSLVKDYVQSQEGQEIILNTIDNNPTRVRRSIGG